MAVDVSVVVPVYNPGGYLDPCVDSLLGQSLPPERLELIFVDDGSTDDTPERLDRLAAEHPHVRVLHRENSGWSGQPRNDGIEAACGTMIHFVDQDDFLGLEALQRMYAMAAKNRADIVLGKVISNGRKIPHHLFRRDRPRTSIAKLPLEDSLTPHKMFRRSLLLDHDIRFPTNQRLEDQPFLLRSYFATDRVSILASYPCYHFSRRDDLGNLSFTRLDPSLYYDNLSAILDLVESELEPGATRDRILRRFYRSEVIGRLSEPGILEIDREEQSERLVHARRVAVERFDPQIAEALRPVVRVRARLLQAGDLDGLVQLAESLFDTVAWAETTSVEWGSERLRLGLRAGMRHPAARPLRLLRVGDALHLDPESIGRGHDLATLRLGSVAEADSLLSVALYAVDRERSVDWYQTADVHVELTPSGDPVPTGLLEDAADAELLVPTLVGSGEVALAAAFDQSVARPAIWDVWVRVSLAGAARSTRVVLPEGVPLPEPVWIGSPVTLAAPVRDELHEPVAPEGVVVPVLGLEGREGVSLDFGGQQRSATAGLTGRVGAATRTGDRLDVAVELPAMPSAASVKAPGATIVLRRGTRTKEWPARLVVHRGGVIVSTILHAGGYPGPGVWDVGVRLGDDAELAPAGQVRLPWLQPVPVGPLDGHPPAAPSLPRRVLRRVPASLKRRLRGR